MFLIDPPTSSRSRQTKNLTLIRGSPGICPCLLDAYPPIQSVSWYRNGIAIRIETKGGGYTINHEYALLIKSVNSDDNGEYYCRAQNSEGFGEASKPFFIVTKGTSDEKRNVCLFNTVSIDFDFLEPIKFIMKPRISYSVNEGAALIVPCVAFGNPQPTIRWFRVKNFIMNSLFNLFVFLFFSKQNSMMLTESRQNLTFQHIEKVDHGVYVCHASNEHTTTNITTLINVESK